MSVVSASSADRFWATAWARPSIIVLAMVASGLPSLWALFQTSVATVTASLYIRLIVAMSASSPAVRSSTITRPTRMCGKPANAVSGWPPAS